MVTLSLSLSLQEICQLIAMFQVRSDSVSGKGNQTGILREI